MATRRALALAFAPVAVTVVALASGCFHHQAYLPGVIDMRTDGSGLPAPGKLAPSDPRQTRNQLEGVALGQGLTIAGSDVTVDDRHFWVVGLIPIFNDSATPELEAALATAGTMTRLEIVEEVDALSVVGSMIARFFLPISAWVTPPWTFKLYARAAGSGPAPAFAPLPAPEPVAPLLAPPQPAVPDISDLPPPLEVQP
ncbi:MAG: hypothetical protein IT383_06395 [Deltaproteobacteria bacterium]|nr:hypothetical protein [Deltaproteobacteria bacterium]